MRGSLSYLGHKRNWNMAWIELFCFVFQPGYKSRLWWFAFVSSVSQVEHIYSIPFCFKRFSDGLNLQSTLHSKYLITILVSLCGNKLLLSFNYFPDDKMYFFFKLMIKNVHFWSPNKILKPSVYHSQVIRIFLHYYSDIGLFIDSWYDWSTGNFI